MFHCVHFECPANESMNSLYSAGMASQASAAAAASGPPNSPHLVLRAPPTGYLQMPLVENEHDYFRTSPPSGE